MTLRCARACGGLPIDASAAECTADVELLVATPARLLDLLDRGAASLEAVRFLTLLGADALFDLGFEAHLRRIILDEQMPPTLERQTTLSCAGMSETLCRVTSHLFRARGTARGLVTLTAASPWLALAHNPFCTQDVQFADERAKQPALCELLLSGKDRLVGATLSTQIPGLALVVAATRRQAEMLHYFLQGEGFAVGALPHDRPKKAEKDMLLTSFASGAIRVLVTTDVALSALADELCPVDHVISFDAPLTMHEYCQRLLHTGRCGHTGRMTTLVTETAPRPYLHQLTDLLQRSGNEVPRWLEWMASDGVSVK